MRTVAAGGGFGMPAALLVLVLYFLGVAGDGLFDRRRLGRGECCGVARERLREHAIDLVGPAAVVLDDFVCDFRHGLPLGVTLLSLNVARVPLVARILWRPDLPPCYSPGMRAIRLISAARA